MIRETEWTAGVIVAAVLAAVMFVAIGFVEGAALRVTLLVLGALLAAAAAVVASVWGYVVPREGWRTTHRSERADRFWRGLKTWHSLGGVVTLWAVAAVAVALIALAPAFTALAAVLAAVAVILAAVATVWGDLVQHEPPAMNP